LIPTKLVSIIALEVWTKVKNLFIRCRYNNTVLSYIRRSKN